MSRPLFIHFVVCEGEDDNGAPDIDRFSLPRGEAAKYLRFFRKFSAGYIERRPAGTPALGHYYLEMK